MSPIYILLLVFVVLLGALFIVLAVRASAQAERKKKMSVIMGRGHLRENVNDKSVKDKRLASLSKKLKEAKAEETQKSEKKNTIRRLMIYAGVDVSPAYFWGMCFLSGIVFFLLATIMKTAPIVSIFLFIIGFFGFPRFVLFKLAQKRQKKFLEEFADALESMVRLLKAGMPVGEAIAMIAREFKGPLGEEMSRVYESQRIGVPLNEAVLGCAERVPLPEVKMFATGITIQQQTGSSLSDVLLNLSALIRARFRLRRKVDALSSEAKASAAIIAALPVVVAVGLYFINPDYIGLLFTTPMGKFYLTLAIVWMCMGVLVMKKMINFKI